MKFTEATIEKLKLVAKAAAFNSYSPYSKFKVGASIFADSGRIYSGTNVENASYGLTMCAERAAIYAGIAAGERGFVSLCIYTPTDTTTPPCGACLQVLSEFSKNSIYGEDVYLIGICDSEDEFSGFLGEMYNGKFTNQRFKL